MIGRPSQVQLIFDRWVTKATPGPFRTRVITDGVIPSLHIDYKGTRIKQYHKEGRALRTETTINNTYDFYIGKNLRNLPALRRIGFQANRRLLQVQRISHDCILAEEAFQKINRLLQVASQCVSALRRSSSTSPLARPPVFPTPSPRLFHLRGIIGRIPQTHRYCITNLGLRTLWFCTRTCSRILRPGLETLLPELPPPNFSLRRCFDRFDQEIISWIEHTKLAA